MCACASSVCVCVCVCVCVVSSPPYLGRHVEHQGDDGGVVVAVDDEAVLSQLPAEVSGVLRQLSQPLGAWQPQEGVQRLKRRLPGMQGLVTCTHTLGSDIVDSRELGDTSSFSYQQSALLKSVI